MFFFGDGISFERQNLFSSISILSDKFIFINIYPVLINSKLVIYTLWFLMFKEIRYQELHKIINVTLLGGCRIFLQQSKVSSVHPTRTLNFQKTPRRWYVMLTFQALAYWLKILHLLIVYCNKRLLENSILKANILNLIPLFFIKDKQFT